MIYVISAATQWIFSKPVAKMNYLSIHMIMTHDALEPTIDNFSLHVIHLFS